MIGIPTESLNKFLAIGSLVAMIYMVDICLKNYEKAELARIAAYVNIMEFSDKYKKFANLANDGIGIYSKALTNREKVSKEDLEKAHESLGKAQNMNPEMEKIILKNYDLTERYVLYERLKWIWVWLTFLVIIVCSITAFYGFKGWYKSGK